MVWSCGCRCFDSRCACAGLLCGARACYTLLLLAPTQANRPNVVVYLLQVFTSTSTTVFKTFACDGSAVEGESFLRADYRLSCKTDTYIFFSVYAGLMLLVSSIFIRVKAACSSIIKISGTGTLDCSFSSISEIVWTDCVRLEPTRTIYEYT